MLAIINSIVLVGLEGQSVRVDVDISSGLPVFEIVDMIVYTIYACLDAKLNLKSVSEGSPCLCLGALEIT
ncbi:hypothetical protein hamaS1_11710 [Moorella sp. Hama-1]|nr:hypothetical protein hamaS1_11710 [Moorella sp. Hama-1]